MELKLPFVATCKVCGAPITESEAKEKGIKAHSTDLHWRRLVDISMGRPARLSMSDVWIEKDHAWNRDEKA